MSEVTGTEIAMRHGPTIGEMVEAQVRQAFAEGRRQGLEEAAKDARENLPAEIEKGLMEFYEKGHAEGLDLAAKFCDASDKSAHPADLADAIRALKER